MAGTSHRLAVYVHTINEFRWASRRARTRASEKSSSMVSSILPRSAYSSPSTPLSLSSLFVIHFAYWQFLCVSPAPVPLICSFTQGCERDRESTRGRDTCLAGRLHTCIYRALPRRNIPVQESDARACGALRRLTRLKTNSGISPRRELDLPTESCKCFLQRREILFTVKRPGQNNNYLN